MRQILLAGQQVADVLMEKGQDQAILVHLVDVEQRGRRHRRVRVRHVARYALEEVRRLPFLESLPYGEGRGHAEGHAPYEGNGDDVFPHIGRRFLLRADDQAASVQCDGRDRKRRDEDGRGLKQADGATSGLEKQVRKTF